MDKKPGVRAQFLFVAILVLAASGCDDLGPSEPRGPGAFQIQLVSPNGAEGSAVFELSGGIGLGAFSLQGGEAHFRHEVDGTRLVIILDQPGEIRFQLQTQDLRELPDVVVTQVADGDDRLRASLSGYEVVLVPVEEGGAP